MGEILKEEREFLKATDMSAAAAPVYDKFEKNSKIDESFGSSIKEAFAKIEQKSELSAFDNIALSMENSKGKVDAGEKTIVEINSSKRARIKEIDRQNEIRKLGPKMLPKRTSVQESKSSKYQNANDDYSRGR